MNAKTTDTDTTPEMQQEIDSCIARAAAITGAQVSNAKELLKDELRAAERFAKRAAEHEAGEYQIVLEAQARHHRSAAMGIADALRLLGIG